LTVCYLLQIMNNMETQSDENKTAVKKKRPLFLTILCIISLLGITYIVLASVYEFYFPSASEKMLEKLTPFMGTMFDTFDTGTFIYISKIYKIIGIIAALVCLPGVILMWKLKRVGFIFYLIGELAPVISFLFLFWNFFHNPLMSIAFLLTSVLKFIVAAALIIMYAVNLKRMS
jgi:hypothetical protein